MERPTTPATITLLDGKERTLRYSMGTMKRMKTKYGKSVLTDKGLEGLDEEKLPEVIWFGLIGTEPGITVEQVEELIDGPMYTYVLERLVLAFRGSAPPEKNEMPKPPEIPTPTPTTVM